MSLFGKPDSGGESGPATIGGGGGLSSTSATVGGGGGLSGGPATVGGGGGLSGTSATVGGGSGLFGSSTEPKPTSFRGLFDGSAAEPKSPYAFDGLFGSLNYT